MSSFIYNVPESFNNHVSQSSGSTSKLEVFSSSLFDFPSNHGNSTSRSQPLGASPLVSAFSMSPSNNNTSDSPSDVSIFLLNQTKLIIYVAS